MSGGPNEKLARIAQVSRQNPANIAASVFDPAYFATLGAEDQQGLLWCLNSGLENPDSKMGCYACQPDDYDRFKPFFAQVLAMYHGVSEDATHRSDWNLTNVQGLPESGVLDVVPLGLPPLSMRVQVARNLAAFPLPGSMTRDDRCGVENFLQRAFSSLIAMPNFGGEYVSLTPGHPNEVDIEQYEALVDSHMMFKNMSADPYLAAAGIAADWPYGRGAYISQERSIIVWVGGEDHLRIMSMQLGTVLNEVFERLKTALDIIESIVGQETDFAISQDYGVVTSCPTNLVTGMRASVLITLPNLMLTGSDAKIKEIAEPLGLAVRGTGGEHTSAIGIDGTVDISPSARFCVTEAEIMASLYRGIGELQAAEATAAVAATTPMEAVPPPMTPSEPPPEDSAAPIDSKIIRAADDSAKDPEEIDPLRVAISKCGTENLLELLFVSIDTGSDGRISSDVLLSSQFGELLAAHWQELESNDSMTISRTEWYTFFTELRHSIGAADADDFIRNLCWAGDLDVSSLLKPEDKRLLTPAEEPVQVAAGDEPALSTAEQLALLEAENKELERLIAVRDSEIERITTRLATLSGPPSESKQKQIKGKMQGVRKPRPPSEREIKANQSMYMREQEARTRREARLAQQAAEIEAERNAELDYVFHAKPVPKSSKKPSQTRN